MMKQRLGLLIGGTLALWAVLVYPAMKLLGDSALVQSAAAMLLCLIPASATLAMSMRAANRPGDEQMLAALGGTGARMAVVLGLGWLGYAVVPELQQDSFWLWLIVFYLATLGLEIGILVKGMSAPEKTGVEPPRVGS